MWEKSSTYHPSKIESIQKIHGKFYGFSLFNQSIDTDFSHYLPFQFIQMTSSWYSHDVEMFPFYISHENRDFPPMTSWDPHEIPPKTGGSPTCSTRIGGFLGLEFPQRRGHAPVASAGARWGAGWAWSWRKPGRGWRRYGTSLETPGERHEDHQAYGKSRKKRLEKFGKRRRSSQDGDAECVLDFSFLDACLSPRNMIVDIVALCLLCLTKPQLWEITLSK